MTARSDGNGENRKTAAEEAELRQKAMDEYRKRVEDAAKNAEVNETQ